MPVFGATPDGINDDFVIEVKCPTSKRSMLSYITDKNEVAPKYMAQLQLQMAMSEKRKSLLFGCGSPTL